MQRLGWYVRYPLEFLFGGMFSVPLPGRDKPGEIPRPSKCRHRNGSRRGGGVSGSGDPGRGVRRQPAGELAAAVQERVPVTTSLVDDGDFAILRFDPQAVNGKPLGTNLPTTDFVGLATALGINAEGVEDSDDALRHHPTLDRLSILVVPTALNPSPTSSPRCYRPRELGDG